MAVAVCVAGAGARAVCLLHDVQASHRVLSSAHWAAALWCAQRKAYVVTWVHSAVTERESVAGTPPTPARIAPGARGSPLVPPATAQSLTPMPALWCPSSARRPASSQTTDQLHLERLAPTKGKQPKENYIPHPALPPTARYPPALAQATVPSGCARPTSCHVPSALTMTFFGLTPCHGPASLKLHPPGHSHAPPRNLGRLSAGTCSSRCFL